VVADLSRLFVALPLSEDARQALSTIVRERVPAGLPGRAVPPRNWHLTLRFLGDVDPVAADRLAAALDGADLGGAFSVSWGRLGAFPRPQRATVLWIGLADGADPLAALAARVEECARDAGFPAEDRPFRAHLTLARIRPDRDVRSLVEGFDPAGVTMTADHISLYRSHLGSGGARYEAVEEFPLG
jgi:2'-5' RNA ligase